MFLEPGRWAAISQILFLMQKSQISKQSSLHCFELNSSLLAMVDNNGRQFKLVVISRSITAVTMGI